MPADDKARMEHMLAAAQKAIKLTQKRNRSDLDTDELLSLGLTRLFEIIGEAASKLSPVDTSSRIRACLFFSLAR